MQLAVRPVQSDVEAAHLILSADYVTTEEHEGNSRSLLQHLHAAQRFLSHARNKQCQHDPEYKDEKRLERIHEKNQCDQRRLSVA
jgi:hypothetical protein